MAAREHYQAEFARVAPRLEGFATLRKSALERFAAAGFPTPAQELWKYTDLKPLEKQLFIAAAGSGKGGVVPDADAIAGLDAHRLVFVDGFFAPALSDIGALPAGITLAPLSQLMGQSDLMASVLGRTADGALADLNTAFLTDGLYLRVAAGGKPAKPVHVLYLGHGNAMYSLRNVIMLERNAEATVIEQYGGAAATYFTNVVTQIEVADDARLSRCRLQHESRDAFHLGVTLANQSRASHVHLHSVDFGARLARHDTQVRLDGEHAEIDLQGVYAPGAQQHIDNHTRVDHLQPAGRSRELFKGVLTDNGRGVFNGRIVVHKGAQKTDSAQSSAALLLSKGAEVDAKPELEIYADDVKCSHGATVGQLDEEAVFYLRSRGVQEAGARNILTYSFADDVISRVGIEPLRRHIETHFLARLPQGGQLRELL